jgi:hypothetical protein
MSWIMALRARLMAHLQRREEQVFLLLSLLIGALTGLAVVGFRSSQPRNGLANRFPGFWSDRTPLAHICACLFGAIAE